MHVGFSFSWFGRLCVWPPLCFFQAAFPLAMRGGARGLLSLAGLIWPGSLSRRGRSVAAFSSARARDMPPDVRGSK